jgi:hypothetical protein
VITNHGAKRSASGCRLPLAAYEWRPGVFRLLTDDSLRFLDCRRLRIAAGPGRIPPALGDERMTENDDHHHALFRALSA